MLSPEERRLLVRYCWDHQIAVCSECEGTYKLDELGAEMLGLYSSSELCSRCRIPLVDSIRAHMASCTVMGVQTAEAGDRAATLQQSSELQKESQQARDRAMC